MKYILILIILFFVTEENFSQSTDCKYTYFKNKKKSTSQCWDENKYAGKAIAYNQKGEVIGEWKLSRMHMISSVQFSFYDNGGVKTARFSSHPDAGIQHYHSTTTYDENGNKTDFHEEDYDGKNYSPTVIVKDKNETIKKTDSTKWQNQENMKSDSVKVEK